jgi:hypothetical protein
MGLDFFKLDAIDTFFIFMGIVFSIILLEEIDVHFSIFWFAAFSAACRGE